MAGLRLVVNADDLGLHPSIDRGIFEAKERGIVTSATLLAAGRTAREAVARAKEAGLGVGVHLCLSTGLSPLAADVPTVAPGGRFRKSWAHFAKDYLLGRVRRAEVDRELRAQVQAARGFGGPIDHLDAHQHLHGLPGLSELVVAIAREEGLPLRWPSPRPRLSWLSSPSRAAKATLLGALSLWPPLWRNPKKVEAHGIFEAGALSEDALLSLLASLGSGDHELGCHPGYDPGTVPEDPSWRYGWDEERRALQSERVKAELQRRGVRLCRYSELF